METKELKITPPKGYEIDKENSTLECIKFKLKLKRLTYEEVIYHLSNKNPYISDTYKDVSSLYPYISSKLQLRKLIAINQLMNVAKYLNDDWKPNWMDYYEKKYFIAINRNNTILLDYDITMIRCKVYFKSRELAQQAINILGEDTIRLALSTDW